MQITELHKCRKCQNGGIKHGKSSNGIQRLFCKKCKITWQSIYIYNACKATINQNIIALLREGCGTRSISRLLRISTTSVSKKIIKIAKEIQLPTLYLKKSYEIHEICTYISKKKNKVWIVCALEKCSKQIVRFCIGKRTNKTLRKVIRDVLISEPIKLYTDKLKNYQHLIPREIHNIFPKGIQNIERMNLNLRTHLKRLGRKTIAYSKSLSQLSAIIKIYLYSKTTSLC